MLYCLDLILLGFRTSERALSDMDAQVRGRRHTDGSTPLGSAQQQGVEHPYIVRGKYHRKYDNLRVF